MAKENVRDRWQIALYVPADLKMPIKREARRRDRSYGMTILQIVRAYFNEQNKIAYEQNKTQTTE